MQVFPGKNPLKSNQLGSTNSDLGTHLNLPASDRTHDLDSLIALLTRTLIKVAKHARSSVENKKIGIIKHWKGQSVHSIPHEHEAKRYSVSWPQVAPISQTIHLHDREHFDFLVIFCLSWYWVQIQTLAVFFNINPHKKNINAILRFLNYT